jgi:predicted alpha/beta-fold hydrolase
LRSYRRRLRLKAKLFPERYKAHDITRCRSLREWDEAMTAPASGYDDASHYYCRASALPVVSGIRVPTLIITAQDDPIVPFGSFCDPRILDNPFITLIATQYGGIVDSFRDTPGMNASGRSCESLSFARNN